MKILTLCIAGVAGICFAGNLGIVPAPAINVKIEPIQPVKLEVEVECIRTEASTNPPWLAYRDPPWSANVQVPDVYDRNDNTLSMAVGPDGRIYVAYTTLWNASPACAGFGLASSTDGGMTWDNRVYRVNNTAYSEFNPEITLTNDGKIWLWGTLNGGGYTNVPCWMRSSVYGYNNPDSLKGFLLFNIPYRFYPECVSWGNGNQLLFAQYTVDRTGSNDSVFCVFSYDSTNWWVFTFRPPGGNPGMTSIGLDVPGSDTILIHAIEYYDAAGSDWDVVWYLDTLNGSGNFYGWSTNNPLNDRYPSVFCTQGYAYIAMQSEVEAGNNDILFNYSTDYGASWNGTFVNLDSTALSATYPRLSGFATTIGCAYNYPGNAVVRFNYSVWNGQEGTWQVTPEVISDSPTSNESYHTVALLWTPAYFHAAFEDQRNSGTDGIEIYTSRRSAPVAVKESDNIGFGKLRLYPNPFKDKVTIELNNEFAHGNLRLKVYDLTGKLLATHSIIANSTSVVWNGADDHGRKVPGGIYVIRITNGKDIVTEKVILLQ